LETLSTGHGFKFVHLVRRGTHGGSPVPPGSAEVEGRERRVDADGRHPCQQCDGRRERCTCGMRSESQVQS